ncbi:MAG: hypothetical protein ACSLFI_04205, partial [Solirubrobacterales bacterium]
APPKSNSGRRPRNSGRSQKNGRTGNREPKAKEASAEAGGSDPGGAALADTPGKAEEKAPEPAKAAVNQSGSRPKEPKDEKSVNSGRFGLRRGRRKRGRKSD